MIFDFDQLERFEMSSKADGEAYDFEFTTIQSRLYKSCSHVNTHRPGWRANCSRPDPKVEPASDPVSRWEIAV